MFNSRRKIFLFVFLLLTICPLVIILLPGSWQRCKASGKMMLASVSVENGKLNRDTSISSPSVEVVNDRNPPFLTMVAHLIIMSSNESLLNDLKLIDKDLANAQPKKINNISVSQIDETNVLEISYYHDRRDISEKVLNLLMRKFIQFDRREHKERLERINNASNTFENRQIKERNNEANKDAKTEEFKAYQQIIKKEQIYLKAAEQYISQLPAKNSTSSVNYEIVKFADSSCPIMGHLNLNSIYPYWHSHWVYFRYSLLGRYI